MIALFSLTLGLLVFLATKEIFGPLAAVLALFLFAFEPNLLANGAIVTTDMGLALFLFASVYTFYRFCNRPSAPRLALCAVRRPSASSPNTPASSSFATLVLLALVDLFLPAIRQHRRRVGSGNTISANSAWLFITSASSATSSSGPSMASAMLPARPATDHPSSHPPTPQRSLTRCSIISSTFLARHHLLPRGLSVRLGRHPSQPGHPSNLYLWSSVQHQQMVLLPCRLPPQNHPHAHALSSPPALRPYLRTTA